MRDSIGAFHAALDAGRAPALDGRFGAELVGLCETIAAQVFAPATPRAAAAGSRACRRLRCRHPRRNRLHRHTSRPTLSGRRPARLGDGPLGRDLPAVFGDERVMRPATSATLTPVARAIDGAPAVVNLAHGGGGASFEEDPRRHARRCRNRGAGVPGSRAHGGWCMSDRSPRCISAHRPAPVTGATPPDPQAARRGDYARAKALCDACCWRCTPRGPAGLSSCAPAWWSAKAVRRSTAASACSTTSSIASAGTPGATRCPLSWSRMSPTPSSAPAGPRRSRGDATIWWAMCGSARDYLAELAAPSNVRCTSTRNSPTRLWLEDLGKWLIKRATGRAVRCRTGGISCRAA